MEYVKNLFRFPTSFLKVYPPIWLGILVLLVAADLGTKKLATDHLMFHLGHHQATRYFTSAEDFMQAEATRTGAPQIDILGENGEYISFELVFNDRFVFGLGWSLPPVFGLGLTLLATLFLGLYRWHNPVLGHPVAWLFIFSGAFGNLIDKMFLKSLATREWVFSLTNEPGYVWGVVDFVKCIWFGWKDVSDIAFLNILSLDYWPTFNLADSLIVVGIGLLLFTIRGAEHSLPQEGQADAE
ncbi:MAG: signal peptidase II [Leptospiraceae bacterium]|nr:signal peptidase II [Leptospiraceae bacterium]